MSLSTCLAAFFTHFDAELEFLLVLPDMLKGGSHSWNAWYNVHACTEQNAVAVDCNSSNVRIYHVFIRLSGLLSLRRICYLQHLCFFQEDPSNVLFPDTKFMLSWGEPPREDKVAFVLWVKSGIKWYMKTYIHLAGAVWVTGIFRSLTLSKHPVSDWRKEEKTLIKAHIHALNGHKEIISLNEMYVFFNSSLHYLQTLFVDLNPRSEFRWGLIFQYSQLQCSLWTS